MYLSKVDKILLLILGFFAFPIGFDFMPPFDTFFKVAALICLPFLVISTIDPEYKLSEFCKSLAKGCLILSLIILILNYATR